MKPLASMRKALKDPNLLGNTLNGDSWHAWRVLLIAMVGEKLTDAERTTFKTLTQREREPLQRVEEFVAVAGRRGGKSRAMSVLAAYVAGLCDHRLVLAPGETGVVLLVAPSQRQAKIVLNYVEAVFQGTPILRQLIVHRTQDTLELNNHITIEVRPASYRSLRGPTYLAAILDESAFFYTDVYSVNADVEIMNAVRPALATTRGPLIIASSPYAKRGVLWNAFKRDFGPDGDPLVLVAKGGTREFNTTVTQRYIDRQLAKDRAFATGEYMAEFRDDIAQFVPFEVVQGCVGDHRELAPVRHCGYSAFVDPSGGGPDSFTLAISHRDGDVVVIDAVREVRPPSSGTFSPEAVAAEFAVLCNDYRITNVTGDQYAGVFPRELFLKHGVSYELAEKTKSDLYRDLLPLLNSGRVVLPNSERLVNQLCGLERRVSRAGKDSIDHGPGGHDDLANACAGAADLALKPGYDHTGFWIDGVGIDGKTKTDRDAEYARTHTTRVNIGIPMVNT
jgi:hypothetical protein